MKWVAFIVSLMSISTWSLSQAWATPAGPLAQASATALAPASSKAKLQPPSEEELELMKGDAYATSEIFWSAFSGYAIGFGTGHLIEGVWLKRGWYFTVSDAAAAGLLVQGVKTCGINDAGCDSIRGTSLAVGMILMAGSRLWQLVDTIRYPIRVNKQKLELESRFPEVESAWVPIEGGAGLVATFRF